MNGVRRIASAAVQRADAARPLESPVVLASAVATSVGTQGAYNQAYLEGFAAGEADGRKEVERQASQSLKQLEKSRADVEMAKTQWQNDLRKAMEKFALAIARQNDAVERLAAHLAEIAVHRIVGRLHADRRAVEAICMETLRALRIESAQVRVSPADFPAFCEMQPGIEVIADSMLEPGACLLRSPQGDIDAGLATQLAQLHEAFAAVLSEAYQ